MGKLRPRRYYLDESLDTFHLLPADPGSKSILVEGPFVRGKGGDSRECTYSRGILAAAKANPDLFPHKVFGVQTILSRVDIVDRVRRGGAPAHVRVYKHNGRQGVKNTDCDVLSSEDLKKPLLLKPVLIRDHEAGDGQKGKTTAEPSEKFCLRGALARAVDAGFISKEEALRRKKATKK